MKNSWNSKAGDDFYKKKKSDISIFIKYKKIFPLFQVIYNFNGELKLKYIVMFFVVQLKHLSKLF